MRICRPASSHSAPDCARVKHVLADASEDRGSRPELARLRYLNRLFRWDCRLMHHCRRMSRPMLGPSAVSMRDWAWPPGERPLTSRPSASNVRRRVLLRARSAGSDTPQHQAPTPGDGSVSPDPDVREPPPTTCGESGAVVSVVALPSLGSARPRDR